MNENLMKVYASWREIHGLYADFKNMDENDQKNADEQADRLYAYIAKLEEGLDISVKVQTCNATGAYMEVFAITNDEKGVRHNSICSIFVRRHYGKDNPFVVEINWGAWGSQSIEITKMFLRGVELATEFASQLLEDVKFQSLMQIK